MLTTAQIEAARELARIGFAHSDAIDGQELGYMSAVDAAAYRSSGYERRADAAIGVLLSDRLPHGPLSSVIDNAAEEIVSRLHGAQTRISAAAIFQSAYTLALACGLDPNKV